jgi:cysteine protease ATG4
MFPALSLHRGRPSSSHYFVGVQSDHFFYLDPHTCRSLLPLKDDPTQYTKEEVDLCHTRRLRRINVRDMDPSMLLAFLIRDEKDLEDWKKGVEKVRHTCNALPWNWATPANNHALQVQGKRVVAVSEKEPPLHGHTGGPREEAIAEVEAYDGSDEEGEGEEVKEDVGEGWVQ